MEMMQPEVRGPLSSSAVPVPSETTIFLDCTGAIHLAKSASNENGQFSFEFDPPFRPSLFQFGNTGDFDKPQLVAALDLADAHLVSIELLHAKAKVTGSSLVFLMLLCDPSGRVIERQRLPFWPLPRQTEFPIPSGTATASFVVRLGGSGTFEELKLRATVFRDRDAKIASQLSFTFVLRIPPPEKPGRWLEVVPASLRLAIAKDFIEAQQLAIGRLKRQIGSVRDSRDMRPSLEEALENALSSFQKNGLASAIGQAIFDATEATAQSRLLEDFAARIEEIDRGSALRAYWFAYGTRPDRAKAQKLALKMFKSGNISSAASLFKSGPQDSSSVLGPELQLCARLFEKLPAIPVRAVPEKLLDGGLAYVAASAAPYMISGYTVRTHELLTALRHGGLDVRCSVRPGFPWDRSSTASIEDTVPEEQWVGKVPYYYSRLELDGQYDHVIERTAAELECRFRQWRPRIVQAASNHRNAFPALIAARRIGADFIYEVRGLWELSAATTNPGWEKTERFALERKLELTIASAADRVLTITRGVANELIGAGVDPNKIELLPNAVDTDLFQPFPKDRRVVRRI